MTYDGDIVVETTPLVERILVEQTSAEQISIPTVERVVISTPATVELQQIIVPSLERILVESVPAPGAGGSGQLSLPFMVEFLWDDAYPNAHKELLYDLSTCGDVIQINIWDTPQKTTYLFSKVITYLAGSVSEILTTFIPTGNTYTKTYTYDSQGRVIAIDRVYA